MLRLSALADVDQKVAVIVTSAPIPNEGIAFSAAVPDTVREQIVDALMAMNDDDQQLQILNELFGWSGLVERKDSVYNDFRQLL